MVATSKEKVTLDELLSRAWLRELVPDGDVVSARVPELPGCFAEGATLDQALENLQEALESWLSTAVELGNEIPAPRGDIEPETHSGRFSVRVPRSLHRRLALRSEDEDCSINQLIVSILSAAVDAPLQAEQPLDDIREQITADAVAGGPQAIGALKGIATYVRNRGDINLACLLYALAGERVAAKDGAELVARELGAVGALARREKRMKLAEALWRESLRWDYTNIRSLSSLGQLLHHQGRYEEAVESLEPVADIDNYAQLFLGWSQLQLGLSGSDSAKVDEGLANVVASLRRWCAYSDQSSRGAWLWQVQRLWRLGSKFRPEVEQLVSFAKANSNWSVVTMDQVEAAKSGNEPDDDLAESRSPAYHP